MACRPSSSQVTQPRRDGAGHEVQVRPGQGARRVVVGVDPELAVAEPAHVRPEAVQGGRPATERELSGAREDVGLEDEPPARPVTPEGVLPDPCEEVRRPVGHVVPGQGGRQPAASLAEDRPGLVRRCLADATQAVVERPVAGVGWRCQEVGDPARPEECFDQRLEVRLRGQVLAVRRDVRAVPVTCVGRRVAAGEGAQARRRPRRTATPGTGSVRARRARSARHPCFASTRNCR